MRGILKGWRECRIDLREQLAWGDQITVYSVNGSKRLQFPSQLSCHHPRTLWTSSKMEGKKGTTTEKRSSISSLSNYQRYHRKGIFQLKIKDQNKCKTYEAIWGWALVSNTQTLCSIPSTITLSAQIQKLLPYSHVVKKICLSILKVYLNSTYWPKGVIIRNNRFLYKSVT